MKIQEYLDKLDKMDDDVRAKTSEKVINIFSPVGKQSMLQFQRKWFEEAKRPYEDYVKAQNEEIKKCIALEMSAVGKTVREHFGMPPMTAEMEIPNE